MPHADVSPSPAWPGLLTGWGRAVVAVPALVALASLGGASPVHAAWVGLLAWPCGWAQAALIRRRVEPSPGVVALTLALIALALVFVQFQTAYAEGVLASGSLKGGLEAIWSEVPRLRARAPGDAGRYAGLSNYHLESLPLAAVAVACTASTLTGVWIAGRPSRPRAGARVVAWLRLHGLALAIASVVITLTVAVHPVVVVVFLAFLVPMSVPLVAALFLCSFAGDALADAVRRRGTAHAG